jgi:hypothetical protein
MTVTFLTGHTDNGATCCRARRRTAAAHYRGRVPAWLWVLAPRWMHRWPA